MADGIATHRAWKLGGCGHHMMVAATMAKPKTRSAGRRYVDFKLTLGGGFGGKAVPGERFELPTNGLQNRCSTTELTRLS